MHASSLGCLEPVLTICALLSGRSPFTMPLKQQAAADRAKRALAGGQRSDHAALLNAFTGWRQAERCGQGAAFCWEHFLSNSTLRMAADIREQFRGLLSGAGLLSDDGHGGGGGGGRGRDDDNRHSERWGVVSACLVAGLFPNIVRVDVRLGQRVKPKFWTVENGLLKLHPASVNASVDSDGWQHRWLTYSDKQRTQGGLMVYDTTELPPLALLLFGNAGPLRRVEVRRPRPRRGSAATPADDAVQFVTALVRKSGGEYGMAALSGLVKRQKATLPVGCASIHRFGIRRWVEAASGHLNLIKRNNRWVIVLAPGVPMQAPDTLAEPGLVEMADAEAGEEDGGGAAAAEDVPDEEVLIFHGPADHCYFELDEPAVELLGRVRAGLAAVSARQALRQPGAPPPPADRALVDAVCGALDETAASGAASRRPATGGQQRAGTAAEARHQGHQVEDSTPQPPPLPPPVAASPGDTAEPIQLITLRGGGVEAAVVPDGGGGGGCGDRVRSGKEDKEDKDETKEKREKRERKEKKRKKEKKEKKKRKKEAKNKALIEESEVGASGSSKRQKATQASQQGSQQGGQQGGGGAQTTTKVRFGEDGKAKIEFVSRVGY